MPRYASCAIHETPESADVRLANALPVPFAGRPKSPLESTLWRLKAGKPDNAIENARVLLDAASMLSEDNGRAM